MICLNYYLPCTGACPFGFEEKCRSVVVHSGCFHGNVRFDRSLPIIGLEWSCVFQFPYHSVPVFATLYWHEANVCVFLYQNVEVGSNSRTSTPTKRNRSISIKPRDIRDTPGTPAGAGSDGKTGRAGNTRATTGTTGKVIASTGSFIRPVRNRCGVCPLHTVFRWVLWRWMPPVDRPGVCCRRNIKRTGFRRVHIVRAGGDDHVRKRSYSSEGGFIFSFLLALFILYIDGLESVHYLRATV